jgi:murein DD-endopeptidase MepM/ murein hydrolase activator NlpD
MTLFTALAAGALLIPTVALIPSTGSNPAGLPPSGVDEGPASRSATAPPPASGSASSSTPAPRAAVQTPTGKWNWPLLPRPGVIRGFQVGPARWSAGHRGVDLAAWSGAAVHAPADGVVLFAGVLAGRAVLSIDHGGGLISSFEPAASRFPIGTPVKRGEVVAAVAPGPTHCLPTVCLHWGVRKNGRYIDPLPLLLGRLGPAVLLPMLS